MHGAYRLSVTMTALACNLQNFEPHTNLLRCCVFNKARHSRNGKKYKIKPKKPPKNPMLLIGLSEKMWVVCCVAVMLTGAVSIVTAH